jgi:hypothetical protein
MCFSPKVRLADAIGLVVSANLLPRQRGGVTLSSFHGKSVTLVTKAVSRSLRHDTACNRMVSAPPMARDPTLRGERAAINSQWS